MISDLYDALVCAFKEYGCPAVVLLGKHHLAQHTAPLRVVLWQESDQFAPPLPSKLPARQQAINPRSVATRRCGVVAQLWATAPTQRNPADQYRADLAYSDALVNQVMCALNQLSPGITVAQGGAAAELNSDVAISGLGYELRFSVDVPIIDVPWPAQQLSECSQTWTEAPATAEVTIEGKVDPEPPYFQPQPSFPVPTAPDPP